MSAVVCDSKKVFAQGPARLDYSALVGNQTAGTGGSFIIKASPAALEGPYLHLFTNDLGATGAGSINYIAGFNANTASLAHTFQTRSAATNGSWDLRMAVQQNGQVRIGATLPDLALHGDYKLAVAGKIVGQSLYITRPASWADHVFATDYRLRPLAEVADYIACHQHLPDVPSATQALAQGYDVSEMNAKLLQKVEELTLYVLQLNAKLTVLETKAAPATPQR